MRAAAILTVGLLGSVLVAGTADAYGGHSSGGSGHATSHAVGGAYHGHGWGGHGWGGHGWGGRGWYGGYGWGFYGYPYFGWPYAYSYYDPSDYGEDPYFNADDQDGLAQDGPPQAAPQQQPWYYCDAPKGYYPYVRNCSHNWQPVAPTPPPPHG
jgi:hypothetical protein